MKFTANLLLSALAAAGLSDAAVVRRGRDSDGFEKDAAIGPFRLQVDSTDERLISKHVVEPRDRGDGVYHLTISDTSHNSKYYIDAGTNVLRFAGAGAKLRDLMPKYAMVEQIRGQGISGLPLEFREYNPESFDLSSLILPKFGVNSNNYLTLDGKTTAFYSCWIEGMWPAGDPIIKLSTDSDGIEGCVKIKLNVVMSNRN